MKNFTKLFLFMAFTLPALTYGQNEMAHNTNIKTFASSANLSHLDVATKADLDFYNKNFAAKDKCGTYKGMRTAGIVMTIAGPVMFVGGVVLLISGLADDLDSDEDQIGRAGFGLASMATGIIVTGAGVPLMIIGGIKAKKYCPGGRTSMSLGTQKNGVGAALTF